MSAVAIVRGKSVLLATRAADKTSLAGFEELPGGKIKEKETAAAGAVRELEEELGVAIAADRVVPLGVFEVSHVRLHVFVLRWEPALEQLKLRAEDHSGSRWVHSARLAEVAEAGTVAPADVPALHALAALLEAEES